jgi:phosphoserine phosphatase
MDGGIGTRYAVDSEGLLTGDVEGPFIYGEGKVEAMQEFAGAHGVDLAESYAYSDSASDLPMLRAVGNPVVVNPDEELARVAREEDWRVMRFEKLGRRLAVFAGTAAALVVGVAGRSLAARPVRSRGGRPRPSIRRGR